MSEPLKGSATLGKHARFKVKARPFVGFDELQQELSLSGQALSVDSLTGKVKTSGPPMDSLELQWVISAGGQTVERAAGSAAVQLTESGEENGLNVYDLEGTSFNVPALQLFDVIYDEGLFDASYRADGQVRLRIAGERARNEFGGAFEFKYGFTVSTTKQGLASCKVGDRVPMKIEATDLPLPSTYRYRLAVWDDTTNTNHYIPGEWLQRQVNSDVQLFEPQAQPIDVDVRVGFSGGSPIYPLDSALEATRRGYSTKILGWYSYALQVVRASTVGDANEAAITVCQVQDSIQVRFDDKPKLVKFEAVDNTFRRAGTSYQVSLDVELANFSTELPEVACSLITETPVGSIYESVSIPRSGSSHKCTLTPNVSGSWQPDELKHRLKLSYPGRPGPAPALKLSLDTELPVEPLADRIQAQERWLDAPENYVRVSSCDSDRGILGLGDLKKVVVHLDLPRGFVPANYGGKQVTLVVRLFYTRERSRNPLGGHRDCDERIEVLELPIPMTPRVSRALVRRGGRIEFFSCDERHDQQPTFENDRLGTNGLEDFVFRLRTYYMNQRSDESGHNPSIEAEVELLYEVPAEPTSGGEGDLDSRFSTPEVFWTVVDATGGHPVYEHASPDSEHLTCLFPGRRLREVAGAKPAGTSYGRDGSWFQCVDLDSGVQGWFHDGWAEREA